jgi:D-3-phosphoglycerate dehydrogenase / 2-oxoglutarate reductase
MPKVLIAPMTLAGLEGGFAQILRAAGFELIYPTRASQMTEEELLPALAGIDASVAGSEPYTRRVLDANPRLKVIARVGVGYDAVDTASATEHGVAVTTTPGANHDAVAEHTFALILALVKGVVAQHNALRAGGWPRTTNLPLRGRTLGIAGLGRIGKAVALRGECFGMKLLAYEPVPDPAFVQQHRITLVSFEELLAEADFVSLHMPLTPHSRHIINKQSLSRMKPTAFLINTARGGMVCEADLVDALRTKRLAGAALDVFEEEPPGPNNPLLALDNVVLTPHAAGGDVQSRDDMAAMAARSIVALSKGEWPAEQIVNPGVRSRFQWR